MKLVVSRADLLRAAEITGAAAVRSEIPILEHTLLRAASGALRLTVNNTDQVIETSIAAEVSREGAITLPTADLHQFATRCPEGCQIEIETEKGRAILRAGRARLTLPTLPAEDFPNWPDEKATEFVIGSADLKALIGRVAFAAATNDPSRHWLMGIHMSRSGKMLRAAASDGKRLALTEIAAPDGCGEIDAILPRDLIPLLKKLPDGETTIRLGERIEIACGDTLIRSRLIDGTFPDFDRIIPRDTDITAVATVDTKAMAAALKRLAIAANDTDRAVSLEIGPRSIIARTPYAKDRDAEEEIDAHGPDSPVLIGFNIRLLIAQLDNLDSDTAEIAIVAENRPARITAPGREGHLQLLSPVHVPVARRKAA
jgi:DNA polymerase-3 subunit beta